MILRFNIFVHPTNGQSGSECLHKNSGDLRLFLVQFWKRRNLVVARQTLFNLFCINVKT